MNSSAQAFYRANPMKELLVDSIPEGFVKRNKDHATHEQLKEALISPDAVALSELFRHREMDVIQQIFEIAFNVFFTNKKTKKITRAQELIMCFRAKFLDAELDHASLRTRAGGQCADEITQTFVAFFQKAAAARLQGARLPADPARARVEAAVEALELDFVSSLDPRFSPVRAAGVWPCDAAPADRYRITDREFGVEDGELEQMETGELHLLFLLLRIGDGSASPGAGGEPRFASVQVRATQPITLSVGPINSTVPGVRGAISEAASGIESPHFVAEPIDATAVFLQNMARFSFFKARTAAAQGAAQPRVSLDVSSDYCFPQIAKYKPHFFLAMLARRVSTSDLVRAAECGDNPHATARISLASLFGANTSGEVESLGAAPPRCLQLTCPLSHGAIDIPVRGPACTHIPCFDMRFYVEFALSHRFFNCPICQKPAPVCMLKMDVYARDLITRGYRERVHLDPLTGDPTEPPPPPASESDAEEDGTWFSEPEPSARATHSPSPDAARQKPKRTPRGTGQMSLLGFLKISAQAEAPVSKKRSPVLSQEAASPAGTQGTVEEPIDID